MARGWAARTSSVGEEGAIYQADVRFQPSPFRRSGRVNKQHLASRRPQTASWNSLLPKLVIWTFCLNGFLSSTSFGKPARCTVLWRVSTWGSLTACSSSPVNRWPTIQAKIRSEVRDHNIHCRCLDDELYRRITISVLKNYTRFTKSKHI